jgi:DeoR/GlpR family transcriptional regulator of sugar metabolism
MTTKEPEMKKKRDKKFGLSRETIRELTTLEDRNALRQVVGGSCELTPSTHGAGVHCLDNRG